MNIGDNEGLPTPKELKHSRKATRQKYIKKNKDFTFLDRMDMLK